MAELQISSYHKIFEEKHQKILAENKALLKVKYDQLKAGTIDVDEFMLFIVQEFKRIEDDLNLNAEYCLKKYDLILAARFTKDNIKNTALLLAITDYVEHRSQPALISPIVPHLKEKV